MYGSLHPQHFDTLQSDIRQSVETAHAYCMVHTLANTGSSVAPPPGTSDTKRTAS